MSDWPEINGKPAALIRVGAAEKVGLPKYSNVDIGPVSIERYVEDDEETIKVEMEKYQSLVEGFVADEREKVQKWLASQKFE